MENIEKRKMTPIAEGDRKKSILQRLANIAARWLTHPRLALHLSLVAMILTLPALWVGFQLDDYFHRVTMLGLDKLVPPGPFNFLNVFSSLKDDPGLINFYKDLGALPWWTSSDFHISFIRYLSALSMWIDYKLWPDWPSLMHLHSMFWYAALVAVAAVFYRRIMGLNVVAGLAALFYAVDYSHAIPAAWLANRNALLAAFFGVLCLLSYDQWRQGGKKRYGLASAFCLSLALLSGEMALATGGYLFAYAIFIDPQTPSSQVDPMRPASRLSLGRRLLTLWPHALVFVLWAAAYQIFGFGSCGSGMYIDPVRNPFAFMKAFVVRAPLLLMGQWSHVSADNVGFMISEKAALTFALFLIAIIAFLLFPLVRKDRIARFWLTGMILSFVPVAATSPSNRLLLFVGIGAMGLAAQAIIHLRRNDNVFSSSLLWRIPAFIVVIYLVLVRLVFSPPMLSFNSYILKPVGDFVTASAEHILDASLIDHKDIIVINPPDLLSPYLVWPIGIAKGKQLPQRIRTLSGAPVPVEVYRVDKYSLRIRIEGGLFQGMLSRLFWSPEEDPMKVDQEFHVAGMTARVISMDKENGPEQILYRFSVPLEDPSLRLLQWKDRTYLPFVPPPVGESVVLPYSFVNIFRPIQKDSGPAAKKAKPR